MRLFLTAFVLVLGSLCVPACSKTGRTDGVEHPVGIARLDYEDPDRSNWAGTGPRPLAARVWYPAAPGSPMQTFRIPPGNPVFLAGDAAWEAELADRRDPYPLIIMSHGTGGASMQMMWLGRELAKQGFIAVAVDHHGNTAAEEAYDPRGFRLPWERALDLTRLVDLILDDPYFGPRIDPDRIGAVGYSLGGYSVIALAGGRTDLSRFEEFCSSDARDATCDPQPEFPEAESEFRKLPPDDPVTTASLSRQASSFRDDRIKSFVALAPALVQAFSAQSLRDIDAPLLVIAGSGDVVAPVATNAGQLSDMVPDAELIILGGAGHYVFLSKCNLRGKLLVPVCKDPKGIDRSQSHKDVAASVGRHFLASL